MVERQQNKLVSESPYYNIVPPWWMLSCYEFTVAGLLRHLRKTCTSFLDTSTTRCWLVERSLTFVFTSWSLPSGLLSATCKYLDHQWKALEFVVNNYWCVFKVSTGFLSLLHGQVQHERQRTRQHVRPSHKRCHPKTRREYGSPWNFGTASFSISLNFTYHNHYVHVVIHRTSTTRCTEASGLCTT